MGVIKKYVIGLGLLLASTLSWAQEMPEVHKINGKKYYLHVVEKGSTMYGISKLYNLEISEIEAHNPIVKLEGLKVNQTLLIPVTGDNKRDLGGVVNQSDSFIVHKTQPKETLYSIAKRYNIKLEELLKANPEVAENGLKEGSELRIPMAQVVPKNAKSVLLAKPDTLKSHIVEKGDTYYSLSKRYNTSVESLKAANPLLGDALRIGAAVRIPGTVVKPDRAPAKAADTVKTDTVPVVMVESGKPISVALLLPLSASLPDSSTKDFRLSEAQRVALSFYRGFEWAMDSLATEMNVGFEIVLNDVGQDKAA